MDVASPPEFAMNTKLKIRHNGKVQNLDLDVPSFVKEKAKGKPFTGHAIAETNPLTSTTGIASIIGALAVVVLGSVFFVRRRRM